MAPDLEAREPLISYTAWLSFLWSNWLSSSFFLFSRSL